MLTGYACALTLTEIRMLKIAQQMEEKEKEIRRLQEELKARPTVEVLEERFRVASYQLKEPHVEFPFFFKAYALPPLSF